MSRAIFLVGFMGSGKNTVGQELARRLAWDFVDLDSCIETLEGQSIPEVFRSKGESYFRAAERAALRQLLDSLARDSVVALGGGAFMDASNRQMLRVWPTVFLDAAISELWQRCLDQESAEDTPRPLRRDLDQFARLYEDRLPFYRQASLTIQTSGKMPAVICAEILLALPQS
jgi:shikimate kinase